MNFHHAPMFGLVIGYTMVQDLVSFRDRSPHRTQFVSVAPDVQLEVLDWGETGRPIVFPAGYLTGQA